MNPYREEGLARRAPRATWASWFWALVRGVFVRRWYHRHFIIAQYNDYGGNFGRRFREWRILVERGSRPEDAQRSLHGLGPAEPAPLPPSLAGKIAEQRERMQAMRLEHEAFARQEAEWSKPRAPPPPVPVPGPGRPTLK